MNRNGFSNSPDDLPVGLYGLEFSPNSQVLYATTLSTADYGANLYQFDLAVPNSQPLQIYEAPINAKNGGVWVAHSAAGGSGLSQSDIAFPLGQLQLGPDGHVYLARNQHSYVCFIEHPNVPGSGCNFHGDDPAGMGSMPGVAIGTTSAPGCCGLGLPALIGGEHSCVCQGLFTQEQAAAPCGYSVHLQPPDGFAVTSVQYTIDASASAAGAEIASVAASPLPSPNNLGNLAHSLTGTLAYPSGVTGGIDLALTGATTAPGRVCVDLVVLLQRTDSPTAQQFRCPHRLCWDCAAEQSPCATLLRDGHADPCCGYHLTLAAPAAWGIQWAKYRVAPTTPGATITGMTSTPMPNTTLPPSPPSSTSGLSNTTQGQINFAPPVQGTLQLDLAAVTTNSTGHICVDFTVRIFNLNTHEWKECPVQVCFDCCKTILPRCDTMSWEPCPPCCGLGLSTRSFVIHNDKVPVSPICDVAISFSPQPASVVGSLLLTVDGTTRSWATGWGSSPPFSQIDLGNPNPGQDGPAANTQLEFSLGVPTTYSGHVTVTVTHCDGTPCEQRWPWNGSPSGGDSTMSSQRVKSSSLGREVRAYRLELAWERLRARGIRWIELEQTGDAGPILAITGATPPCVQTGAPCEDLVERTQVQGTRGMITLRRVPGPEDAARPPSLMVLYTSSGRGRPTAVLTYYDADGIAVARSTMAVEEAPGQDDEPHNGPPTPTPPAPPQPTPPQDPAAWPVQFSGAGIDTGSGSLRRALLVLITGAPLELTPAGTVRILIGRDATEIRSADLARIDLAWADTPRGRLPSAVLVLADGREIKTGPLSQYLVEVSTPAGAQRFQWQLRGAGRGAQELGRLQFKITIELPPIEIPKDVRPPAPPMPGPLPGPQPNPVPGPGPVPNPDPGPGRPGRPSGLVTFEGLGEPSSGSLLEFQVVAESGEVLTFTPGLPVAIGQERINWDFIKDAALRWAVEGPMRRLVGVDVGLTGGRRLAFPTRGGLRQVSFAATAPDGRPVRFGWSAARMGVVKTPLTRVTFAGR